VATARCIREGAEEVVVTKRVVITCEECGKKFKVYPYRKDVARYCSIRCRNKAFKKYPQYKKLWRKRKDLWTEEETEFLRQHYLEETAEEIASHLRKTVSSIYWKASKLGIGDFSKHFKRTTRIEKLSVVDRVYLAALIDGEGTITLRKQYYSKEERKCRHKWVHIIPLVKVVNSYYPVMEWVSWVFNRKLIEEARKAGWKPSWRVELTKLADVRDVLKSLLPYFRIKQKQAQIVLEYCRYRLLKLKESYHAPIDSYEKQLVLSVQKLNAKVYSSAKVKEV